MVIKRVGPLSVAKIAGVLYAIMGLLFGGFLSLLSVFASFRSGSSDAGFFAMGGIAAIFVMPLVYGCLGFVFTLIGAVLYNAIAGAVGGIEIEAQ
jgi:hypothetical protein